MTEKIFKAAVIQDTPFFFDVPAICDQVQQLTSEAASNGAKLVLFPESFIPGYPRGMSFGATVGNRTEEGRALWQRYWEVSMVMGDETFQRLSKIAQETEVILAIGITEKEPINGTLYCTYLLFSEKGKLLHSHRKIKPTGSERIIWGEGDGQSIKTVPTSHGRVGGLICWENMMPLARTAIYQHGVDIYLAPTADGRKSWTTTMQHIAMEGRCYVLSANQLFNRENYPSEILPHLSAEGKTQSWGGSVLISPMGEILAGPLFDQKGILYADIDLGEIVRSRLDFHPTGHYARPDIFKLVQNSFDD